MSTLRKLTLGLMAILGIACGTITVDIDTDISEAGEMTHSFAIEMKGQMAGLIGAEIGQDDTVSNEELKPYCNVSTGADSFKFICEDVPHSALGERGEELGAFDITLSQQDTGDGTEYRVSMPNAFREDGSLSLGDTGMVDPNLVLALSFTWDVTMPGEVGESQSNADSYDGSTARFTASWDDGREAFEVVSHRKKSSGLFGSCN